LGIKVCCLKLRKGDMGCGGLRFSVVEISGLRFMKFIPK
jgi:hypothetical protein